MPRLPMPVRQRGIALVVVLWAAIILALLAGGVLRLSRGDLNLTRNLIESTHAELAADSALWTAVYTIVNGEADAWRSDGTVYAWRFGDAEVRVRVTDELGRIDINVAAPELLAGLFAAAGAEPEEANSLADAVVAYRDEKVERISGSDVDPRSGALGVGFAVVDELEQVPGMPPQLYRQIAPAITVYTGQPRPRAEVASPLVVAATEGRVIADADGGSGGGAISVEVESAEPLGDSPEAMGEPGEVQARVSGLLRIEAEALSAGGSYFAREAVVALSGRGLPPYRLRLWRRGARTLFPIDHETH